MNIAAMLLLGYGIAVVVSLVVSALRHPVRGTGPAPRH
jgi:hypothetical protein